MSEWFETWFDSEFYHILYKNRDQREAEHFLDKLILAIPIGREARVLDLACGTGRHANYLSALGFNVTGTDLSPLNIKIASSKSGGLPTASFLVHDMRNPMNSEVFDVVLNLFTSFGYFSVPEDNLRSLRAIHSNLAAGGKLVIDFFNAEKLCASLPSEEVKTVDNIEFRISKVVVNGVVRKSINFNAKGCSHNYKEEVQVLGLPDFERMLDQTGFKISRTFGDYELQPFTPESDRLIFVATKV
jgi:SAM-dependent methyltransferase